MNIYDTTSLYGLAIKATDLYTEFFRAIAVAVEATRKEDKPTEKTASLAELQRACREFKDELTHIEIVCSENTKD